MSLLHHHVAKRGISKGCGGHGAENFSTFSSLPQYFYMCRNSFLGLGANEARGRERVA